MNTCTITRLIYNHPSGLMKVVNTLAIRHKSSQEWLARQMTDPYVEKAKRYNYRCRSAFKLLEMNEKANFLIPGQVVVDVGAAPGSWTQVAVKMTNADAADVNKPKGTVVSIDKLQIFPIEGASVISNMDFTTNEAQEKLKGLLNNLKVDIVISDMAPNASGVRALDQDRIIALCYNTIRFAVQVSKPDASLLMKVWDGGEVPVLAMDLERYYNFVRVMKPEASRSDSSEKFLLAQGFKGLLNRDH